jgi:AcrR family transcriptional regulator
MSTVSDQTGTKARSRGAPRAPLSRERVVAGAMTLADESGIEALSMRKLAKALGVEAMSLYNHVAGKDDLLAGMVEAVLREMELPATGDWKADLRRYAISAHDVLLEHPWAPQLALSPPRVVPVSIERAEWTLRRLDQAGFPPEITYHAFHILEAHVLGFTLWQLGHGVRGSEDVAQLATEFMRAFPLDDYPHMHLHVRQHIDGDVPGPGAFELVLDLILDGLEAMRDGA